MPRLLLITVLFSTLVAGQSVDFAASRFGAQAGAAAQSFEVATIRPNRSGRFSGLHFEGGRCVIGGMRVRDLVMFAYTLKDAQVLGGPKWSEEERYDIEAKVDDAVAVEEQKLSREQRNDAMKLRLQDLLANRFGLKLRHSTKPLPVLALIVAKSGPKFSLAKPSAGSGSDGSFQANVAMQGKQTVVTLENAPLRYLVLILGGQPEVLGRVLLDRTGLMGNYRLKLRWESQPVTAAPSDSEFSGPTLFTALTEQLGLRVESRKEPVDVVEIEHVERPSAN